MTVKLNTNPGTRLSKHIQNVQSSRHITIKQHTTKPFTTTTNKTNSR